MPITQRIDGRRIRCGPAHGEGRSLLGAGIRGEGESVDSPRSSVYRNGMTADFPFPPADDRAFHTAGIEWLKRELDRGLSSRPSAPATGAYWEQLRNRVRAAAPPDGI